MMPSNSDHTSHGACVRTSAPDHAEVPQISVCICSFRRPLDLRKLLASLGDLNEETPSFEVIVVDNDCERSAEPVVAEAKDKGLAVTYMVEPQQNISLARNRAFAHARAGMVAFIDDDEWADPAWLVTLHKEMKAHDADAVFGPVVHEFSAPPPRWLVEIDFFHYSTPTTGTTLHWMQTRTSNVLMTKSIAADWPEPFDPVLGLEGGEDVDLFARMIDKGYRLVAAENAVVFEKIPPERMKLGWLVRRFFRNGVTAERIEGPRRSGFTKIERYLRKTVEAPVRFGMSAATFSYAPDRGAKQFLRGVLCLGILYRSLGFSFHEYVAARIEPKPPAGR